MKSGFPLSPTDISAVAPRCLLGLTFPEFHLAPKVKSSQISFIAWKIRQIGEARILAIADLIWYSACEQAGSLTWLLWALRSFRRYTLHYIRDLQKRCPNRANPSLWWPLAMRYVQNTKSRCKYTSAFWTLTEGLYVAANFTGSLFYSTTTHVMAIIV